jgi:hypothetical protein
MSTLSHNQSSESAPAEITTVAFAHAHVEWFPAEYTQQKLVDSGYQVTQFENDYFDDAEAFEREAETVMSNVGALVVSRFHPHLNEAQDMQVFDRIAFASAAGKQVFQIYDSLAPNNWLNAWPVRTTRGDYVGDVMAEVGLKDFKDIQKMKVWSVPRADTVSGLTFDEHILNEELMRQGA